MSFQIPWQLLPTPFQSRIVPYRAVCQRYHNCSLSTLPCIVGCRLDWIPIVRLYRTPYIRARIRENVCICNFPNRRIYKWMHIAWAMCVHHRFRRYPVHPQSWVGARNTVAPASYRRDRCLHHLRLFAGWYGHFCLWILWTLFHLHLWWWNIRVLLGDSIRHFQDGFVYSLYIFWPDWSCWRYVSICCFVCPYRHREPVFLPGNHIWNGRNKGSLCMGARPDNNFWIALQNCRV